MNTKHVHHIMFSNIINSFWIIESTKGVTVLIWVYDSKLKNIIQYIYDRDLSFQRYYE